MKRIICILIICIVISCIGINYYKVISNNNVINQKKKIVIEDEKGYGEDYQKFKSEVYIEKPIRIIYKKDNTINEFFVFDKSEEEYEHLLKVAEDRMYYSSNQDCNLWGFAPRTIEDISKSNNNFIIFDYDEDIESKDYTYDIDFNRNIFFTFPNNNRLYRLLDYLTCLKEPIQEDELKKVIGKNDFIPESQLTSGYKYMHPSLNWD